MTHEEMRELLVDLLEQSTTPAEDGEELLAEWDRLTGESDDGLEEPDLLNRQVEGNAE